MKIRKTFTLYLVIFPILIMLSIPCIAKIQNRGWINFKLIDLKNSKVIEEADLPVTELYRINLGIPDREGQVYFEDHFLKINDEFVISFNMYGYKKLKNLRGFGITLKKLNERKFSWEWYDQIGENVFRKRQGKGRLIVEFDKRKGYWVVSSIKFVGDHILRAKKLFKLIGDNWPCVIKDDSYIKWYDSNLDGLGNKNKKCI